MKLNLLHPVARIFAALAAVVFGISAVFAVIFGDWLAGGSLGVFAAACAYGAVKGKDIVAGEEPHRTFRLTSIQDFASPTDETSERD